MEFGLSLKQCSDKRRTARNQLKTLEKPKRRLQVYPQDEYAVEKSRRAIAKLLLLRELQAKQQLLL